MNIDKFIKLGIGLLLTGMWLGIIVFKVEGADDFVKAINLALMGLGVYHLKDGNSTDPKQ